MELKRKVAMVAATLAVALGAGHLMQNGLNVQFGPVETAEVPAVDKTPLAEQVTAPPTKIVPLAAGLGSTPVPSFDPAPAPALPDIAFSPAPAPIMAPAAAEPAAPTTDLAVVDNCPVSLDAIASDHATLDLTLIAPCRASERVVLRHGGLTITAMTSQTGSLFTAIPGMESLGEVSALFGDGLEVSTTEPLPDMAQYRRFAVQWLAEDAFQLNAFENGAGFGEAGHVYDGNTQRPLPNIPTQGGYLTVLGDRTAPVPMLAEVYTYPMDAAAPVDLTIEASVTEATCDRELLGEVLFSEAGKVTKTDLTMATPTCDAIGDVLVLNNPLPDLKLAVAN
ncbi:hypothetical protein ACEN2J_06660 [Pseudorhodobacter sp. W20_MBD10_FR17]|uniref:hypothetical protein n=1 Tax=Pseudorhodobacter sp. W20_MBD10_FR17 TaxID=3240266 RepID=UPI003F979AF4